MIVTDQDRDVLARILWGEARGEWLDRMVAVAWSIHNRAEDGKEKSWWGEGDAGVCRKL
jgi:N-acetylmuramoyl-L-alanine amidase